MKKLAAQALAFQYRLQIETAQTILNNNNSSLNTVDQALHDIINATEKLKMLNNMMVNSVEEIKKNEKDS
jgi:hypothetical protein